MDVSMICCFPLSLPSFSLATSCSWMADFHHYLSLGTCCLLSMSVCIVGNGRLYACQVPKFRLTLCMPDCAPKWYVVSTTTSALHLPFGETSVTLIFCIQA